MKIFKFSKKTAQTVVEYLFIGILVAVPIIITLVKMNPKFFQDYLKSSTPSGKVENNGQLVLPDMGN